MIIDTLNNFFDVLKFITNIKKTVTKNYIKMLKDFIWSVKAISIFHREIC